MTKKKICSSCKSSLTHSDFSANRRNTDGLEFVCMKCRSEKRKKEYRTQNVRRYGITISDYNRMLIQQNGLCAICESDNPRGFGSNFHIDHCHQTKKVRALLCTHCNTALGLFEENPEVIRRAAEYIEKHKNALSVINGGMNG